MDKVYIGDNIRELIYGKIYHIISSGVNGYVPNEFIILNKKLVTINSRKFISIEEFRNRRLNEILK